MDTISGYLNYHKWFVIFRFRGRAWSHFHSNGRGYEFVLRSIDTEVCEPWQMGKDNIRYSGCYYGFDLCCSFLWIQTLVRLSIYTLFIEVKVAILLRYSKFILLLWVLNHYWYGPRPVHHFFCYHFVILKWWTGLTFAQVCANIPTRSTHPFLSID